MPRETTLHLVTLGAALLGGALAANLLKLDVGVAILVVGVAAVIAWAIAVLLTTPRPVEPWGQPDPGGVPDPEPGSTQSVSTHGGSTQPPGNWWEQTAAPLPGPVEVRPPVRVAQLPLASQLPAASRPPSAPIEAAVVAQCPRCGGFRLDVSQNGGEYSFGCRDCSNTWLWRPDRPWPPVVVRRNLQAGTPAAETHPDRR